MLYELAPSLLKLSLRENKRVSIAVRIPTKQAIPTEIIKSVNNDLKKLSLIEPKAIFMFSDEFNYNFYS